MKLGKLFKLAKKGAKRSKKPGGPGFAAAKWPAGARIGVFGHENTGKSVYFTVLYHASKVAKDLQISVTDTETSRQFLENYMSIWGFGTGDAMGTIINQKREKKFPATTDRDSILQFTAILDGKNKIPVVTYDYSGKFVSISEHTDESKKILDFMTNADGILFFFDHKILGADMEVQARASAFVHILEQIVPLKSRLPIPIGLVINKSDTLSGYKGEDSISLVDPGDEQCLSDNYEHFFELIMNSEKVTSDKAWASSVRNVLVKLREFLRVVIGRTLDFQVFFISNTGNVPVKVGTDIGRSIYEPPDLINPCGVKDPFYWILKSIIRNKQLNVMRRIVKYAAAVSIGWIVLYSLPFLYHFNIQLAAPYRVENSILSSVEGNRLITSSQQRTDIIKAYDRYSNKWTVKKIFPEYQITAARMKEIYGNFNMGPALARLDSLISKMTNIVSDPDLRPQYDPGKDSLIYVDTHLRLKADLEGMHIGDKSSTLYLRSDRVLRYWDLFVQWIQKPNDTELINKIYDQVGFNEKNAANYIESEKSLGVALLKNINAPTGRTSGGSVSNALTEFDQLKQRINSSTDAEFIFEEAVADIEAIRGRLLSGVHDAQLSAINAFLDAINKYKDSRQYTCILQTVPDMGHLHIEVTPEGKSPAWSKETQLLEGDEVKLKWKVGEDIHIAFDELKHPCNWGNQPSAKVVLQGKYSLFSMETIVFKNINKTVKISFEDELGLLPKLK